MYTKSNIDVIEIVDSTDIIDLTTTTDTIRHDLTISPSSRNSF